MDEVEARIRQVDACFQRAFLLVVEAAQREVQQVAEGLAIPSQFLRPGQVIQGLQQLLAGQRRAVYVLRPGRIVAAVGLNPLQRIVVVDAPVDGGRHTPLVQRLDRGITEGL